MVEELSRSVPLGRDSFSSGGAIRSSTGDAVIGALDGFRKSMDLYGVSQVRAAGDQRRPRGPQRRRVPRSHPAAHRDRVRHHQRGGGGPAAVPGGARHARDARRVPRRAHAAARSRRRQHQPDAAAARRADPLRGLRARIDPHPPAARPAAPQPRRPDDAAPPLHLEHHRGNPGRGAAEPRSRTSSASAATCGSPRRRSSTPTTTGGPREIGRERFLAFCDEVARLDEDEPGRSLPAAAVEAETLLPALLVYRALVGGNRGPPDRRLRCLAAGRHAARRRRSRRAARAPRSSAARCWPAPSRSASATGSIATTASHVADLAVRLFDELVDEHGLGERERLLLQVAALLHDVGIYVSLRAHHKHSQYILAASQIFGLSDEETAIVVQHRPLSSPRPAAEDAPAVHRARPRGSPHRQQARGDPARRQRARRRTRAEGPGRAAGAHAARTGCCELEGDWRPDDGAAGRDARGRDMFAADYGRQLVIAPAQGHDRDRADSALFLNRELSWLAFNERVLEEAADPHDAAARAREVRGDRRVESRRVLHGPGRRGEARGRGGGRRRPTCRIDPVASSWRADPAARRTRSSRRCTGSCTTSCCRRWPGAASGSCRSGSLGRSRRAALGAFFRDAVLPVLTPLAIDVSRPFPLLASLSLNLALLLDAAAGETAAAAGDRAGARRPDPAGRRSRAADGYRLRAARGHHPRPPAAAVPGPGDARVGGHPPARDAELELDDEGGRTHLELVEREVRRRRRSDVVRLEVESSASEELVALLRQQLELEPDDVYAVPGRSICGCCSG